MKKILILACLFCAVAACRSVKYGPVRTEIIENDSISKNDSLIAVTKISRKDSLSVTEKIEKRDSVIIRDSSVMVIDLQGNVLRTEVYKTKESYNTKELQRKELQYRELESRYKELQSKYEALLSKKQKTIEVPYPVEKPLSGWQNLKLQAGGFAITAIIFIVLIIAGKMIYKLKK